MTFKNIPSPNYSSRGAYAPRAIVIHVMEGTLAGTDSWFSSKDSKVSAHYGIGKTGETHRYVDEQYAAWHAGRVATPTWTGIIPAGNGQYINPNLYTIGIEHEGNENSEWTDEMYQASAALISDICARYALPKDRAHIIGHHEIYALKTCPGFKVDLNKLISMAGGATAATPPLQDPTQFTQSGTVVTSSRLNLRPKPDRRYPPIDTIAQGIRLVYSGYTLQGEAVDGNSKWFFTEDGKWFWSGGVTVDEQVGNVAAITPGTETTAATNGQELTTGLLAKIFTTATAQTISDMATSFNKGYVAFSVDTNLRQAHFFAQMLQEVGTGAEAKAENLNYASTALPNIFSYFKDRPNEAEAYGRTSAHPADQPAIANRAYSNKYGNGDVSSGDGWKYRGKGYIQLTFKNNYVAIQQHMDAKLPGSTIDIIHDDTDILTTDGAMLTAMAFFSYNNIQRISDQGSSADIVNKVTAVVNKNTDSYDQRVANFNRIKGLFGIS